MSEVIQGDAGRVAFLLKGDYDSKITYDFLDVVYYNGASYGAKMETTGNPPSKDSDYWQLLAGYELTKEDICNIIGYIPAKASIYGDNSVSMGRKEGTTVGNLSFSFGRNAEASGERAISLGKDNTASGSNSFACGSNTVASGNTAFAEGFSTNAIGANSHAEGAECNAYGSSSHAEGNCTTAFNPNSHSSGSGSVSAGFASYSEGMQTISGNGYILHVKSVDSDFKKITFTETYENFEEAFSKISVGIKMHVINIYYINTANIFTVKSVDTSTNSVIVEENIPSTHFTPWLAILSVFNDTLKTSHSEGQRTIASGENSHAEGQETKANGNRSHAENYYTVASGQDSHAGGYMSESKGMYSFAHGRGVIAGSSRQTAVGWYNVDDKSFDRYINPFVVGIGANDNNRSNGFRVSSSGAVYGKAEYNSSGADYAEFIKEWHDGNPDNEDRVGYFVTVKNGYLHKANEGDYIVGITSGNPSVVGNSDEEYYWRWERDEFNRIIYEEIPELTEKFDDNEMLVMDESGKPVMIETGKTITVMKQHKDYNSALQQSYIERKYRKEWDYVGMVGVVPVRDDGMCEVGKYCKCGNDGIATLSEQRDFDTYMVLDRISDNIVSVILK